MLRPEQPRAAATLVSRDARPVVTGEHHQGLVHNLHYDIMVNINR